jgi:hypothetical protein
MPTIMLTGLCVAKVAPMLLACSTLSAGMAGAM